MTYQLNNNSNPLQYSCLGNPTEEPGVLQSMWSQRVGHNLATEHSTEAQFVGEQGGGRDYPMHQLFLEIFVLCPSS